MEIVLENLDDHCWPKHRDLFDPKANEGLFVSSSFSFRHKKHFTVQSARQKRLVYLHTASEIDNLVL